MADLSFSFNWSQASSVAVLAASAISAVGAHSGAWDTGASKAIKASSLATHAHSVANLAASAISAIATHSSAWDVGAAAGAKAAAASSAIATHHNSWASGAAGKTKANSLASTVVRSIPAAGSRAVHEILVTSAGLVKYVYSSVAA
jgi:hypothetical protein